MKRLVAVAAVAAGLGIGAAVPAQAVELNGVCEHREACFYWDSNFGGAKIDLYSPRVDFSTLRFLSPGAGAGQYVKNNSASVRNHDYGTLRVYYNENYTGVYDEFPPYGSGNLVRTWNDNASFKWFF
ncbi:peptidase inhibitor family I36 protein [Antribacter gilvus]|uniref:peptidase inhibitor family I36 protein n=1 Tax=Antribacter gilvus TaxID=2304675 RepID=UPI0013E09601|nr:peptidase inhibitor family I36 protein [Antribacter gilvus]